MIEITPEVLRMMPLPQPGEGDKRARGDVLVIAEGDTDLGFCARGNVGLATSGSGDVLAGIIAGLVARGAAPFVATCWGVFIHATAGDHLADNVAQLGFLARELLLEIPGVMAEIARS